jgi:hypothetical protein
MFETEVYIKRLEYALAAAEAELAAFRAECDKVGIPYDAEGLVRHHRGNAGVAGAAQGMAEYVHRLTAAEAERDRSAAELTAAEARIAAALISASIEISPLEEWDAANIADFLREIRRALSVEAAGTEGGG